MKRRIIPETQQQPLPLGDAPDSEASLRDAFERSGLARQRWTFERAIRIPLMRKCLANIAEARMKALADAAKLRSSALALVLPLPVPPISEDGFVIAIILAVLAGGVLGCILTLIRRRP